MLATVGHASFSCAPPPKPQPSLVAASFSHTSLYFSSQFFLDTIPIPSLLALQISLRLSVIFHGSCCLCTPPTPPHFQRLPRPAFPPAPPSRRTLAHLVTPRLSAVAASQLLIFNTPLSLPHFIPSPPPPPRSRVPPFHLFLLESLTVSSPVPASPSLFKGAHAGLGNPALHTTFRCGLFFNESYKSNSES